MNIRGAFVLGAAIAAAVAAYTYVAGDNKFDLFGTSKPNGSATRSSGVIDTGAKIVGSTLTLKI